MVLIRFRVVFRVLIRGSFEGLYKARYISKSGCYKGSIINTRVSTGVLKGSLKALILIKWYHKSFYAESYVGRWVCSLFAGATGAVLDARKVRSRVRCGR